MKLLVMTILAVLAAAAAYAGTTSTTKKTLSTPADDKPKVGTDFKFDDLTVHGQYQSANEGLVTVENDKELTNLLDYRTEYKDRLRASRLNP